MASGGAPARVLLIEDDLPLATIVEMPRQRPDRLDNV